jgi:hypothetical protein
LGFSLLSWPGSASSWIISIVSVSSVIVSLLHRKTAAPSPGSTARDRPPTPLVEACPGFVEKAVQATVDPAGR